MDSRFYRGACGISASIPCAGRRCPYGPGLVSGAALIHLYRGHLYRSLTVVEPYGVFPKNCSFRKAFRY